MSPSSIKNNEDFKPCYRIRSDTLMTRHWVSREGTLGFRHSACQDYLPYPWKSYIQVEKSLGYNLMCDSWAKFATYSVNLLKEVFIRDIFVEIDEFKAKG